MEDESVEAGFAGNPSHASKPQTSPQHKRHGSATIKFITSVPLHHSPLASQFMTRTRRTINRGQAAIGQREEMPPPRGAKVVQGSRQDLAQLLEDLGGHLAQLIQGHVLLGFLIGGAEGRHPHPFVCGFGRCLFWGCCAGLCQAHSGVAMISANHTNSAKSMTGRYISCASADEKKQTAVAPARPGL